MIYILTAFLCSNFKLVLLIFIELANCSASDSFSLLRIRNLSSRSTASKYKNSSTAAVDKIELISLFFVSFSFIVGVNSFCPYSS